MNSALVFLSHKPWAYSWKSCTWIPTRDQARDACLPKNFSALMLIKPISSCSVLYMSSSSVLSMSSCSVLSISSCSVLSMTYCSVLSMSSCSVLSMSSRFYASCFVTIMLKIVATRFDS